MNSHIVQQLLDEVNALTSEEVWNVRVFAGLRRCVQERRTACDGLLEISDTAQAAILTFLASGALARLDATARHWRSLDHWSEHWFLLGVQDFGAQRRLVPPGRFERFDEAMLATEVNWPLRYGNFVRTASCPSMEHLRLAALRVVRSVNIELCDVLEVRRRLSAELQLKSDFLSIESVEQLLEDASTMRSVSRHHEELDT